MFVLTLEECAQLTSALLRCAVNCRRVIDMTATFWPRVTAQLCRPGYAPKSTAYLKIRVEPGRLAFLVNRIEVKGVEIRPFSETPSRRRIDTGDLPILSADDLIGLKDERCALRWSIGSVTDGTLAEEMLFLIRTPLLSSDEPFRLPVRLISPLPFISLLTLTNNPFEGSES